MSTGRSMLGSADSQIDHDSGMDDLAVAAPFYAEEYRSSRREDELRELQSDLADLTDRGIFAVLGLLPEDFEKDVELVMVYDEEEDETYISQDFHESYGEEMQNLASTIADYGPVKMSREMGEPVTPIDSEIGAQVAYDLEESVENLSEDTVMGNQGTYLVPVEPTPR